MLHTTEGIVLHSLKYGDTSLIVRILTPKLGMQSYLVQGVRKSKSRFRASHFQPFTLVEMVAYHKEKSGLQRIKELRCPHPTPGIQTDIRKTSLAIFLCEILSHTFKHQEPQPEAFRFIYQAVLTLEQEQENLATFHIVFLLQLSRYLGFFPGKNYSEQYCFFSLTEGLYQSSIDNASHCLGKEESYLLYHLTGIQPGENPHIKISAALRKILLHKTIDYYRLHLDGFKEIKSLPTLEVVFG